MCRMAKRGSLIKKMEVRCIDTSCSALLFPDLTRIIPANIRNTIISFTNRVLLYVCHVPGAVLGTVQRQSCVSKRQLSSRKDRH